MQVAFFLPSNVSPSTPATAGVPAPATDAAGASFATILASNGGGTPAANPEPASPAATGANAPVSEEWQDEPAVVATPDPEVAVTNALSLATQAAAAAAAPAPVSAFPAELPADAPLAAEERPTGDEPDLTASENATAAPTAGDTCVPAHRAGHGRALGHTKGNHQGGHHGAHRPERLGAAAAPVRGSEAPGPATQPEAAAVAAIVPATEPDESIVLVQGNAGGAGESVAAAAPAAAGPNLPASPAMACPTERPERPVAGAAPSAPPCGPQHGAPRRTAEARTEARAARTAGPAPAALAATPSDEADVETTDTPVEPNAARPPASSPRAPSVRPEQILPQNARGPEVAPVRSAGLAQTEPAPRPAAVLGRGEVPAPAAPLPTAGLPDGVFAQGGVTMAPVGVSPTDRGTDEAETGIPSFVAGGRGAASGPRRDEPATERASGRPSPAVRSVDTPAGWRVGLTMQRLREGAGERAAVTMPPSSGAVPGAPANPMSMVPTLTQVLVEQRAASVPTVTSAATPAGAEAEPAGATPAALRPSEGTAVAPQPTTGLREAKPGEPPVVAAAALETSEAEGRSPVAAPTDRPARRSPARENFADPTGLRPRATGTAVANDRGRNFLDVEKHGVGEARATVGTFAAKESQPMTASSQVLPPETATSLEVNGTAAVGGRESAPASPVLRPSAEAVVRHSAAAAVRETVEAAVQMRESNRHSVDLVLDTPSAEKLRVHLRWHDGVVQAKFVAQTTELQQALAHEWEHAAPRLAERTVKFGEPSFERHDHQSGQPGGQGAFSFEQQRQSSRGREHAAEFGDELGFALSSVRGANRATAAVRPAATTQSPKTPKAADTRNLSAWA